MGAASLQRFSRKPVPVSTGIGLRAAHEPAFIEGHPPVGWLEVHSENYFAAGGPAHAALEKIRADYALSLHGVGLSLGSTDPLDRVHLEKLRALIERYEPVLVSEHLSWSSVGGRHVNDLLPLPYTVEALENLVSRVEQTQETLGRAILIENPSSYFEYGGSDMAEHDFIAVLAQRTGCKILLDVNNLYVNERNHGVPAGRYIDALPHGLVSEMHLAGHSVHRYADVEIAVDTHSTRVCAEVWRLYEQAVQRFGRVPTLVEWDSELPALPVLIAEAHRADRIMERVDELAA